MLLGVYSLLLELPAGHPLRSLLIPSEHLLHLTEA